MRVTNLTSYLSPSKKIVKWILSTCHDSVVREMISSRLRNSSRILRKSSENTASVFLLLVSNLDWNESGNMKSWDLVPLKDEKINCVDLLVLVTIKVTCLPFLFCKCTPWHFLGYI